MSGKSIPKIEGFLATKSLRDDVLNEMADYLAAKGAVKPSYGAAVIARENVFPTGIPCEPIGVAIPHSDRALVEDTTILVAKLPQGVTFTRIDDGDLTVDVRVVFMLAVNSDQGQLDTIAQVGAAEGYITEDDVARLLKFRDNPSDESWIQGGEN